MKHSTSPSNRILTTLVAALSLSVSSLWAAFPAGTDNFASAPVIPSGTLQSNSAVTDITDFDVEPNEITLSYGKHTAWWKWTAPANGWVTFHALDNSYIAGPRLTNSYLTVFKGAGLGALSVVEANNNVDGGTLSRVSFYATSGVTYCIQLDSANASYGQALLTMRFYQPTKRRILGSEKNATPTQVDLTTSVSGAVTGKLMVDGKVYFLKGTASVDGYFESILARKPLADGTPLEPLMLSVDLLPDGAGAHWIALEGNSSENEPMNGYHALTVTTAAPHGIAPYHTATLKPTMQGVGNGYLTARVSSLGAVAMAGRTGDGKSFTSGSVLCEKSAGLHAAPFGMGSPLLTGTITFQNVMGGVDTLSGVSCAYKRREALTSLFYRFGFETSLNIKGGAYVAPAAGQRALGFLNVTGGAGHLALDTMINDYFGFTESVTFSAANTFAFANPTRKLALKLNRLTGAVTGSFVQPTGKVRYMYGMLAYDSGVPRIFGYVAGPVQTGKMSLLP